MTPAVFGEVSDIAILEQSSLVEDLSGSKSGVEDQNGNKRKSQHTLPLVEDEPGTKRKTRHTQHTQPGWLENILKNFNTVIVQQCSARTMIAVAENEVVQVIKRHLLFFSARFELEDIS